jgi:hypothetical protein
MMQCVQPLADVGAEMHPERPAITFNQNCKVTAGFSGLDDAK